MLAQEKVLLAGLDEGRIISLCQRLVRIPTVSPYSGDKPSSEWAGLLAVEGGVQAMGATLSRIPAMTSLHPLPS